MPVTVTVSKTMCAPCKRSRTCFDETVLDYDVRAHGLQTRDMQIHGSRSDRTAARQRYVCLAEPRDQRPEHENRCAHRLDQFVRCLPPTDIARIDLDIELIVDRDHHAHRLQQGNGGGDILQVRHVAYSHRLACQQGSGENRQRSILGAGYRDLAAKLGTTLDSQLIQRT